MASDIDDPSKWYNTGQALRRLGLPGSSLQQLRADSSLRRMYPVKAARHVKLHEFSGPNGRPWWSYPWTKPFAVMNCPRSATFSLPRQPLVSCRFPRQPIESCVTVVPSRPRPICGTMAYGTSKRA